MEQQGFPVLSSRNSQHHNNNSSNALCDQTIDFYGSNVRPRGQNEQNLGGTMSIEELKIRGELEMDIERDLEVEIKDGIYQLALRLHRLYQHQKERIDRELSMPGKKNHQGTKKKTLSEVNINIKLEGGTKIEIKEIKKEALERTDRPQSSRSENVQGMKAPDTKKFDWAKSLRSGPGSVTINKKVGSSNQARMPSNDRGLCMNIKVDNARRNCTSTAEQRKGNLRVENRLLELGWRC